MAADGSTPMSFMMMGDTAAMQPSFVGLPMDGGPPISMLPMSTPNVGASLDPALSDAMMAFMSGQMGSSSSASAAAAGAGAAPPPVPNVSDSQPVAMMMPSMVMTIQSEPGGGSAIELSTNMNPMNANGSAQSGALLQRPRLVKTQAQHQSDHFDEPQDQAAGGGGGGEQYYSSPWSNKPPLASPAKILRSERLRAQQLQARIRAHQPPMANQQLADPSQRQRQQQQQQPRLAIEDRWRPADLAAGGLNNPSEQQRQQMNQALEYEELIQVGPPQMIPIYETPSGQLQVGAPQSPPPPVQPPPTSPAPSARPLARPAAPSSFEHEEAPARPHNGNDLNSEVQTVAGGRGPGASPLSPAGPPEPVQVGPQMRPREQEQRQHQASKTSGRLASPAVKGKQQQQWRPKANTQAGGY